MNIFESHEHIFQTREQFFCRTETYILGMYEYLSNARTFKKNTCKFLENASPFFGIGDPFSELEHFFVKNMKISFNVHQLFLDNMNNFTNARFFFVTSEHFLAHDLFLFFSFYKISEILHL